MKEEKEIEINEENIIIIIFLWSVIIKEGKKENEIEYLIDSTVKVLEWLGRIEEEDEEIKEKEKELIKKEEKKGEGMKDNINRKEMIIFYLRDIITGYFDEDKDKIKLDKRIIKVLLEIVKNHIKSERHLIAEGNKNRIIEYIIYSYCTSEKCIHNVCCGDLCGKNFDASNLVSLPSSFPFSHYILIHILWRVTHFVGVYGKKIKRNDIFTYGIELFCNMVDLVNVVEKSYTKKEIEREASMKWNADILEELNEKISKDYSHINDFLSSSF